MNINELTKILSDYNNCKTSRAWTMSNFFNYENDYISCARLDSSNKWINNNEMIKSWSIIYWPKKDFEHLYNFQQLVKTTDVKITQFKPRKHKELKGCYAIRFAGMKQEPNDDIIKTILDFIFS